MGVICSNCKTEALPDAIYCDHCGNLLSRPAQPRQPMANLETIIEDPNKIYAAQGGAIPVFRPRLVVQSANAALVIPEGKIEVRIGREDAVSGNFPDIDLTPYGGIPGGVSRIHARLIKQGNQYFIEDLQSANSTYVNRQKIVPGSRQPLHHGDELRLGRIILNYYTQ